MDEQPKDGGPTWPKLRQAIEQMVSYPVGEELHVSRSAADKALDWIKWAEVYQSEPVPKLLSEEDEALSLVWRTADGWAIRRTFPTDGGPYWLAMPSRATPTVLAADPAVKALIAAERERCAGECDRTAREADMFGDKHGRQISERTAAAIRGEKP